MQQPNEMQALLDGSRRLAAITDEAYAATRKTHHATHTTTPVVARHLPRDIHALARSVPAAKRAALGSRARPENQAHAHALLAKMGVAAPKLFEHTDLRKTDTLPPLDQPADAYQWDGDVDQLLARESDRALRRAIDTANDAVLRDYEQTHWDHFHSSWVVSRASLMERLCAFEAPCVTSGGSTASAVAATPAGATTASLLARRSRTPRALAYGRILEELQQARASGSVEPVELLAKLGAATLVAEGAAPDAPAYQLASLDSSTVKLASCWKLLSAMASAASPLLRPRRDGGALPADLALYRSHSLLLRLQCAEVREGAAQQGAAEGKDRKSVV